MAPNSDQPTAPVKRAPQQDRSRATHRRLLESTVACLAELGWEGATTTEIARRAGVSRGSLQHHFPTRIELIIAGLTFLFEQRREQLRVLAEKAPEDDRFEFVSRMLLELYTGELFNASLQVWAAAAPDEELRGLIAPLEKSFSREAFKLAVELLHADVEDEQTFRTVQMTLDLARGLGLANLISDDSRRRHRVIAEWTRTLRSIKTVD